jgi:hypothetical protein
LAGDCNLRVNANKRRFSDTGNKVRKGSAKAGIKQTGLASPDQASRKEIFFPRVVV